MFGSKSRLWRGFGKGAGSVAVLMATSGLAGATATSPTGPKEEPFVGSVGELPTEDRDVLAALLREAGVKQAKVRNVERSPERQVKVMLELASADLENAKAMYCPAGDEVLARFDAKASRETNQAAMLDTLVAVLPKAREIGCLNHVRNADVITVDVSVESIPEGQRAALIKAGDAAVAANKVERFLKPPQEPDSFHFEFKRRAAAASAAEDPESAPAVNTAPTLNTAPVKNTPPASTPSANTPPANTPPTK